MAKSTTSLPDRLWAHVLKSDGCWPWTGHVGVGGYGAICVGGRQGKTVYVHRAAWELATGEPIPLDMFVLHTCDTPACTRNDDAGVYVLNGVEHPRFGHLWLGTKADNMEDCRLKGRRPSGDVHFAHLHPELLAHGDRHHTHLHPERILRGDSHPLRIDPSLAARGEENGFAKLTTTDVQAIRHLAATTTLTQEAIGARFGITKAYVGKIIHRVAWAHVPD